MQLVDSNIFIYARGNHPLTPASREVICRAGSHPEWRVPQLVLLELTHYFKDNGAYAREVLQAFTPAETFVDDVLWAAEHCPSHDDFNDHVILANAHRLGAGVISHDSFFLDQKLLPRVRGLNPATLS